MTEESRREKNVSPAFYLLTSSSLVERDNLQTEEAKGGRMAGREIFFGPLLLPFLTY
jgi:hypothetical protein